ncbi:hypothetical protein ACOZ4I_01185 [Haloarcula salina]|uniref:hypothetical protein n=1 Tax=Haloarcula salina TaxID=1429914 RepID=UPI003C7005F6
MTRTLLIYDGRTRLFRAAAEAISRFTETLTLVPWESDAVQAFLRAQFGDPPFALVLIDGDAVHVGEAAVGRALDDLDVARPVTDLVEQLYPAVAAPFGRVVHGKAPADIHGTFRLDDTAKAHIEPLRRVHTIPVDSE